MRLIIFITVSILVGSCISGMIPYPRDPYIIFVLPVCVVLVFATLNMIRKHWWQPIEWRPQIKAPEGDNTVKVFIWGMIIFGLVFLLVWGSIVLTKPLWD